MTRSSADIFAAIASASTPLTLARTADGFLPLLLADLARASDKRLVYVATDDTAMQAVADAAPFFAPDLAVHRFPAWDCLPYDRAGPSMRVSADRLATLSALQAPAKRGELILTTVAAITQRTLTPFRIRQLATTLAPGQRIDRARRHSRKVREGPESIVRVPSPAKRGRDREGASKWSCRSRASLPCGVGKDRKGAMSARARWIARQEVPPP